MKYLLDVRKRKRRAHIWTGSDTVCRMWSTGGMRRRNRYEVKDEPGEHEICQICKSVSERREAA